MTTTPHPTSVPFTIVDVFSTIPFKGNPLAVVDARPSSATAPPVLSETAMKLLARQFNLSETTFFLPPTNPSSAAQYRLRSFLPDGREVFGAGHNILGAWWHLASAGLLDLPRAPTAESGDGDDDDDEFVFHQELGPDVIPVRIVRRRRRGSADWTFRVSMRQAPPRSHATHPDPAALAESVGLAAGDIGLAIGGDDARLLPPQVMSTSTTHHLLVPVASVEALGRVAVQKGRLLEELRRADQRAYGLFLFTPAPPGSRGGGSGLEFQARFFSPGMSGEDPATGSAAGPLAAYLYEHGVLGVDEKGAGRIVVHQGQKVGRECVIEVEIVAKDGAIEVNIVGSGVEVARGSMLVPAATTTF
ncbi:hypothetical protein B0T21DRAFT_49799 [Apiosordaria backusii]|uniref:Phenazine biosynthesis protein n=1 Tax=Apiosordaria backusii TaxID=314023 RepID=A0AA40E1Z0_9PEZI|nr:hypothetical protein B0T21DRAFT_49799 [Apiosordaria backusii]